MSGKKKGNIANPDLHSSESPAKDGNDGFLAKPLDVDEMMRLMAQIIKTE